MDFAFLISSYSQALYELLDSKNYEATVKIFHDLENAISEDEQFLQIMDSKILSKEEKKNILEKIIGHENTLVVNFLSYLVDRNHFFLFVDIANHFLCENSKRKNYLRVEIESAFELSETEIKKIIELLTHKTGKKIDYELSVNSELLGGFRIIYDSKTFDYSVRGKLKELTQASKKIKENE